MPTVSFGRGKTNATIHVTKSFLPFQKALDDKAYNALDKAATVAEREIQAHMTRETGGAPSHHKDRHTKDSIMRVPGVGQTKTGWIVSIISPQPNALWQERGTHSHKGRPKRKATRDKRRAAGIVSGTKPLRFFRNGLVAAFPHVIDEMARNL